jgi:hypothetical protein
MLRPRCTDPYSPSSTLCTLRRAWMLILTLTRVSKASGFAEGVLEL